MSEDVQQSVKTDQGNFKFQRQSKKAKIAQAEHRDINLEAAYLLKHKLDFTGQTHYTPACSYSSRVTAQLQNDGILQCWLATGKNLYTTQAALKDGDKKLELGKEGVLLPSIQQTLTQTFVSSQTHDYEIQNITSQQQGATTIIASVDSSGHACVSLQQHAAAHENSGRTSISNHVLRLTPGRSSSELGWAGISLCVGSNGGSDVQVATARAFSRLVCTYHNETLLRTIPTLLAPCSIGHIPHVSSAGPLAGLVACGEQNMVSLWDIRQGERQGAVQRLSVSPGGSKVLSLAWCTSEGGLLGAAGDERSVTLLDPRKWRVAHKWPGAAKYSIHYLAFSPNVPHYCYVAGQDYECVARRWDGSAGVTSGNANSVSGSGHGRAVGPAGFIPGEAAAATAQEDADATQAQGHLSFRGDSRWLGMAVASSQDQDVVVATTESQALYILGTQPATQ